MNIKDNMVYLYAEYEINGVVKRQIIPSGIIDDLIYEEGMTSVKLKKAIFKDNTFIDCSEISKGYNVGFFVNKEEYLKMYQEKDPRIRRNKEEYLYVKEHKGNVDLVVFPNKVLGFKSYDYVIKPKMDGKPIYIPKTNYLEGYNCWYIELHNGNKVTYERTYLNDKKYRGQKCDYYTFVLMCEYKINNEERKDIIFKEEKQYPYHEVNSNKIDEAIDGAKKLLQNDYHFKGFNGVSPLYRFSTEDSACVFHDNKALIQDQNIVTVTGSGDAILDLFMQGARKIISFDINLSTRFWAELKFIGAKYLSFEDYMILTRKMDYNVYNKIRNYLTSDTRRFWDGLYEYANITKIDISDNNLCLFYPSSIFSANRTIANPLGYCNKENYYKLQGKLKDKEIEDISFVTCDIYDLPNSINLKDCSYAYLSNIMDFIVGVDKESINRKSMKEFKSFVETKLIPALSKNPSIDLCYLDNEWHAYVDKSLYYEIFSGMDGYCQVPLSNKKAELLMYRLKVKKDTQNMFRYLSQNVDKEIKNNKRTK